MSVGKLHFTFCFCSCGGTNDFPEDVDLEGSCVQSVVLMGGKVPRPLGGGCWDDWEGSACLRAGVMQKST